MRSTTIDADTRLRVGRGIAKTETEASEEEVSRTLRQSRGHLEKPPSHQARPGVQAVQGLRPQGEALRARTDPFPQSPSLVRVVAHSARRATLRRVEDHRSQFGGNYRPNLRIRQRRRRDRGEGRRLRRDRRFVDRNSQGVLYHRRKIRLPALPVFYPTFDTAADCSRSRWVALHEHGKSGVLGGVSKMGFTGAASFRCISARFHAFKGKQPQTKNPA